MGRFAIASMMALALGGAACGDDVPPPETSESDTDDGSLDPLSAPAEPIWEPSQFNSAAECAICHPTHVEEWAQSRHAYAMIDPVFRELVARRQQDLDGVEDQFCTQCHSSVCTRGGECVPGFEFEELSSISLEGITCEACHKVQSVQRPYNSGHVIDPDAPLSGPIADPVSNVYHESKHDELFDTSEFCGGCHDVVETSGMNLERPYAEWLESPARQEGKNCQACHMPTYTGEAALGAPERSGVHHHRFVGVELPLVPEVQSNPELVEELDAEIDELLRSSAALTLEAADEIGQGQQLDLFITVENLIDGHAFPTGSTNLRQVWIAITATDANGDVIYETGQLDSEGDLGNVFSTVAPHSDNDLLMLSSTLVDISGTPTVFSWNATEHDFNSIPPRLERTFTLFVPVPDDAPGPIEIEGKIHFRAYPPFLIEELGLSELITPAINKVRDVADASLTVEVAPGPVRND